MPKEINEALIQNWLYKGGSSRGFEMGLTVLSLMKFVNKAYID